MANSNKGDLHTICLPRFTMTFKESQTIVLEKIIYQVQEKENVSIKYNDIWYQPGRTIPEVRAHKRKDKKTRRNGTKSNQVKKRERWYIREI